MKILLQRLYYKLTHQKKKLSPLFKFSDGTSYQEWIDKDNYDERVRELQFELGILKKKKKPADVEFIWCVIGNIIDKHEFGIEREIKIGSKHFSAGTKVYCFPPQWGDGYDNIKVIGKPRRADRFINVIMKSNLIENWRVKKVYNPYVIRQMLKNNSWDETEDSRTKANQLVTNLIEGNRRY